MENKFSFIVSGMVCTMCVKNVENAIKKINGVKYVSVNLATQKAFVIADENIKFEDIKKAVKEVGYNATTEAPKEDLIEKQFVDARQNMYISLAITIPLMILMILHMSGIYIPYFLIIELIASSCVIFITGKKMLSNAWIALRHLHTNMDTLLSIGAISAWSTNILAIAGLNVLSFGTVAAMLVSLNLVGRYIESKMKNNAVKEIKLLMSMKVESANVLINNKIIEAPIDTVKIDDIIIIRQGEKIPLDGTIVEGRAYINESMVNGEPLPIDKTIGDSVLSGTIVENGLIKVKVEKVGSDTFINQMIKLIEEAQSSKVPIQAMADRITRYFVPIVLVLAILSGVFWFFNYELYLPFLSKISKIFPWIITDGGAISTAIFSFVATLVIACPCSLGLATPMALVNASSVAAKKGLIIKNGEAIQMAKDIDTVIFDKTGTITEGKLTVIDHNLTNEVLNIIANIEEKSIHPLAKALIKFVNENELFRHIDITDIEELSGKGIKGKYNEDIYFIGKPLNANNYSNFMEKGETVLEVTKNDKIIGYIRITDKIKADASDTILQIKNLGCKTVMLTGDNELTAKYISDQIGIDELWAGISPNKKVDIIRKYQMEGGKVMMVGDGINDAAALKAADIGVAIGTGADLAIESADIIISKGNLNVIPYAISLSKLTFKKIKQNLFWAFIYNVIAIPLSMMALLHPAIAEAAMLISSINVIYNSGKIRKHNKNFIYMPN
ncbi:MAG: cation-translocating P-type ATPase [Bacteroidales bacterium]|jgi:Cu+-exporting ATPase|nr:cation-translocating P-type ATPase [Bacteroidota bacterium]MDY0401642.1 cation-translocating P-type ATPase [Bacteroidales bacterium]HHW59588.1 cation-translocating P-type ATPase [Bacteroidales bacterium]